MDNKLEKGKNFRVEGSLDSDAVSKNTDNQRLHNQPENQNNSDVETPSTTSPRNFQENEIKRTSTENGNGISVSNP